MSRENEQLKRRFHMERDRCDALVRYVVFVENYKIRKQGEKALMALALGGLGASVRCMEPSALTAIQSQLRASQPTPRCR